MVRQWVHNPPPPKPPENDETRALRRALQIVSKAARRNTGRSTAADEAEEDFTDDERRLAISLFERIKTRGPLEVWAICDSHPFEEIERCHESDLVYLQGAVISILHICGDQKWVVGMLGSRVGMFPIANARGGPFVRAIVDYESQVEATFSYAKGDVFPFLAEAGHPEDGRLVGFHRVEVGLFSVNNVIEVKGQYPSVNLRSSQDYTYNYKPLAANEFRLFKVTKNHLQQFLRCNQSTLFVTLENVPLDQAPPYMALSYCWGDSKNVETIFCDEKVINVPKALARIIRWIIPEVQTSPPSRYDEWETVYLWADAICINQADTSEKENQIPLMSTIYSHAQDVRLYVNESEGAFLLMMGLGEICDLGRTMPDGIVANRKEVEAQLGSVDWDSIRTFVSQPAFRRSWIMQELVLGTNVRIWYGQVQFDLSLLHNAILVMQSRGLRPPGSNLGYIINDKDERKAFDDGMKQLYNLWVVKSHREADTPHNFMEVMRRFRSTEAKDSRDKVYAMLSLSDKGYQEALKPDYSESNTASYVFGQLARYAATRPEVTGLLQAAGLPHKVTELPSWAPDWTVETTSSIDPSFYNCSGNSVVDVHVEHDNPDILSVKGAIVDEIKITNPEWLDHQGDWRIEGQRTTSFINPTEAVEHEFGVLVNDALLSAMKMLQRRVNKPQLTNEDHMLSYPIWQTLVCGRGWGEQRSQPGDKNYYDAYLQYYKLKHQLKGDAHADDDFDRLRKARLEENLVPFATRMVHFQRGRRTCVTKTSLPATVPAEAAEGDFIAIFSGFKVPFVVRKVSHSSDKRAVYQLVGHCYVDGIMDGQLVVEDHSRQDQYNVPSSASSSGDTGKHASRNLLKEMISKFRKASIKSEAGDEVPPLAVTHKASGIKGSLRVRGAETVEILLI